MKRCLFTAMLNLFDESDSLPLDTLWAFAIKAKALAAQLKKSQAYSLSALAQAQAYLRWDNADSARALIEPELAKYKVDNPATRSIYYKLAEEKISCIGNNSNYKNAMPLLYDLLNKAQVYKDSVEIANSMNTLSAWDLDMDFLK
jgi:hypothetical protein